MKRLVFLSLVLSLLCMSTIAGEFQLEVIPANTLVPLSPSIIASGGESNYLDATQSTTYGTITNGPPLGMGTSDLNDRTTLTEASYSIDDDPDLLESALFASAPNGWVLSSWTVSGGFAFADNTELRTMTTKAYDLSSYYKITINFLFASYDTNYIEAGDYRFDVKVTSGSTEGTDIPARTSTTLTSMPTVTKSTTYAAVTLSWRDINADDNERLKIDEVYVYGIASLTYYRFQAVFRFDSVELNLSLYTLVVVFNASLGGSDDLDFSIEAGDTTPDNLIGDNKQDSFSVDVTAYITGETVYLSILDDYRTGDTAQTACYISAIYLYSPAWNVIVEPTLVYFDIPAWVVAGDEGFYFWTPPDTTALNWLIIFLGLFMIPASTIYLVKGGRDNLSGNKVFYAIIAFVLGWALLFGGIGFT